MAVISTPVKDRVRTIRNRMLAQTPGICSERGYRFTQAYKETEGEPAAIRKARALYATLGNLPVSIEDEELIVGHATSKLRGSPMVPEIRWEWLLKEIDTISTRHIDPYAAFSDGDKERMREFLPYWKGKSVEDKWRLMMPEVVLQRGGGGAPVGYPGHTSVDFEKVLSLGLSGIAKEIDAEIACVNLAEIRELEKYHYLRAIKIAFEAVSNFAGRYAALAQSMAKKEANTARKAELMQIADICSNVPACPASSFQEALQCVWLVYISVLNEGWFGGSMGRMDQYLYPFYQKDLEAGKITRDGARELISMLFLKLNELQTAFPHEIAMMWAGYTSITTMTLGGLTSSGEDAVNDLSYLFLEADMDVRLTQEDFVIRIHHNTPDAFVMKACEVARALNGKLKFISDETAVQRLLKDGKLPEDARNYIITGCWCITVPGRSFDFMGVGVADLPATLELALNNGVARLTGQKVGPQTGDPRRFKSYGEVWEAYKKQVEVQIPYNFLLSNAGHKIMAEDFPLPLQSGLFRGCLESGVDILAGGTAPYVTGAIGLRGATNVGDSLAAIKKVVFEDKKLTMAELVEALDRNFEGSPRVLRLLQQAPKFGNDDDYVDTIVNDVIAHASRAAAKFCGFAGSLTTSQIDAGPGAITDGKRLGALPDGRKAGEPITESGISPYMGRDVNGPTATMRSVTKIDHLNFTSGDVLNMKFNPEALNSKEKMRKFLSLIRTYCETGGGLVQFNIVSAETLRDAQKFPERYRDLLVRVATYSAYFVELPREAQENIIARTEYQTV